MSATTAPRLFDRLVEVVSGLGFEFCSYGVRAPFPLTQPRILLFNNYPAAWHRRYLRENYFAIDPTVHHGQRSLLPLVWSDDVFANAREFWEDARGHGLRYGWAQPCRDPNGLAGMLSVARAHEPLSDLELRDKVPRLTWIAQVLHTAMSRLVTQKLLPDADVRLSKREIEVMRWTAEGKTAAEIAKILRISERTVNFHVSNVVRKLNAANKTAAAIRTATLGLLN